MTILRGVTAWRIDLRTGRFMDREPDPDEVDPALIAFIRTTATWKALCRAWDNKYPENPVRGQSGERESSEEEWTDADEE